MNYAICALCRRWGTNLVFDLSDGVVFPPIEVGRKLALRNLGLLRFRPEVSWRHGGHHRVLHVAASLLVCNTIAVDM